MKADVFTPRCGSLNGYRRHQKDGTTPCEACKRAKADYDHRRRSSPEGAAANRFRARAQNRALQQLRRQHPAEYALLYERAKRDLALEDAAADREEGAAS